MTLSKKEQAIVKKNKLTRMSRKAIQTISALQNSKTLTECAKTLGITRGALYERIERYDLMPIIQNLKKQAETSLIVASTDIADNLIDQAHGNGKMSKLQVEVSQDILDRAGVTKKDNTTQQQINIASQDMSIDFIQT